ncbi:MAG: hypothetical protein COA78_28410 [Blastopirellula sp.]|nr:MAG: hypothetical protein COA78_28410 [Blastopirellula sp.]
MSKDNFLYVVTPDDNVTGQFLLTKRSKKGLYVGQYLVTINGDHTDEVLDHMVFCNCMGFNVQKYAKVLHKHVRIALHYLRHNHEPKYNNCYSLDSTNKPVMVFKGQLPSAVEDLMASET